MKVLILKPSSLGDVVQALPVLRMLKRHRPDARVHWWISAELAPLLENDPDLEGIIPFDRREASNPFFWPELYLHVRQMRNLRCDYVLDLQSLARSAVVAWFANGATTIGLDDPREAAPMFHDLSIPRASWQTHAVDWYVSALKPLDVPIDWNFSWLPPRPEVQKRVVERFPKSFPRVVLIPGARWENKRWPLEYFVELTRVLLAHDPKLQITLLGSKADLATGLALKRVCPERVQDLTGRTTLPEMIEVLRETEVAVTNDTGPMHIAAALGIPLVPIFGPTSPARTGPFGQVHRALQQRLPCVPCMRSDCRNDLPLACLTGVTPGQVFTETISRLNLNKRAPERVDSNNRLER